LKYLLITAAAGLGDKAYGAAIRQEIEVTAGCKCSIGALDTTDSAAVVDLEELAAMVGLCSDCRCLAGCF
jgi:hypothetical protein